MNSLDNLPMNRLHNTEHLIDVLNLRLSGEIELAKDVALSGDDYEIMLEYLEGKKISEETFRNLSDDEFIEILSIMDDVPSLSFYYGRIQILKEILEQLQK